MKNYVYPAIFIKDKENGVYRVLFPDLELTTDGTIVEEAFLYAKEFLKQYFIYIEKYDLDFNSPTDFETVKKVANPSDYVMLIEASVSQKDL